MIWILTGVLLITVVLGLSYYFEEKYDFERIQKKNEETIEGLEKKLEKEREQFSEGLVNPFAPGVKNIIRQNPRYVKKTINGFGTAVDGNRFLRVTAPNGGENLCLGKNFVIKWESGSLSSVSISVKEIETPIAGPFGNASYPLGTFPASYNEKGEQNGSGEVSWLVGSIGSPESPGPFEIYAREGKVFQIIINNPDEGRFIEDTSDGVFSIIKCEG